MKIIMSPVLIKLSLTNLAPVKYISILRILAFYLDAAYIYISTFNRMLCNSDANILGYVTEKNDRRGVYETLY